MAQHARPNDAGHTEARRAQRTRSSSLARQKVVLEIFEGHDYAAFRGLDQCAQWSMSSCARACPGTRCLTGPHERAPSLTKKRRAPKTVDGEDEDLDESEDAELAKDDGEGVHEDDFDVEDHEDHRDQVESGPGSAEDVRLRGQSHTRRVPISRHVGRLCGASQLDATNEPDANSTPRMRSPSIGSTGPRPSFLPDLESSPSVGFVL
jgi:hypothetical protein